MKQKSRYVKYSQISTIPQIPTIQKISTYHPQINLLSPPIPLYISYLDTKPDRHHAGAPKRRRICAESTKAETAAKTRNKWLPRHKGGTRRPEFSVWRSGCDMSRLSPPWRRRMLNNADYKEFLRDHREIQKSTINWKFKDRTHKINKGQSANIWNGGEGGGNSITNKDWRRIQCLSLSWRYCPQICFPVRCSRWLWPPDTSAEEAPEWK